MGGEIDKPQEAKIYVARDERKSSRLSDTIIAALIGGAVAVAGMYYQNMQMAEAEKTAIEKIETEQRTALKAIESAKEQAETKLSFDIRSHILTFSQEAFSESGTYEHQVAAVMRSFTLGGVEGALDVHRSFSNGATIRALEQILLADLKADQTMKIEDVLAQVPKVLFLDSRLDANIYCEALVGTGRTNIDAFAPKIRNLPIRMVARSFFPGGDENDEIDEIKSLIENDRPDLIVAHLSTFENTKKDNRIPILQDVIQKSSNSDAKYFPSLILYSRLPQGQRFGNVDFESRESFLGKENSDRSFFGTVSMVGHTDITDEDCFLVDDENSKRLSKEVILAITHQDLYDRNFSKQ